MHNLVQLVILGVYTHDGGSPHTTPHGGSTGDLMYLFMVFCSESQKDSLKSRVLYLRLERKGKEEMHEQNAQSQI